MKKTYHILNIVIAAIVAVAACSCGGGRNTSVATGKPLAEPFAFNADSAMASIVEQCAFGPRVPGSDAHKACAEYIKRRFAQYGLRVTQQTFDVVAWNGDRLPLCNIIASLNPEAEARILVSAHWDSRPWADNDPDEANHHTPVPAANDGASGVAVMIELARTLSVMHDFAYGIDFICFDGEDYGVAKWTDEEADESWCLGSRYWASQPHVIPYNALWGVNLDMVGGKGSTFLREGVSLHYAKDYVKRIWKTAARLGYSAIFCQEDGGYITDDHVPVNQLLGIPTVDIVPYFPACEESSFGPTWHTIHDTPENIEPRILQAVGEVVGTTLLEF